MAIKHNHNPKGRDYELNRCGNQLRKYVDSLGLHLLLLQLEMMLVMMMQLSIKR